jgi:hypothetical protein
VGSFLGFRYRAPLPKNLVGIVPGDFDGDFDVDGHDLLVLQRGANVAADLADWLAMFEGSPAAAAAVPEPSSCCLAAALVVGLRCCRIARPRVNRTAVPRGAVRR